MDHSATVKLCRIIAGLIPQQAFEPQTPALWQPILAATRLDDAVAAVQALGGRVRYIAPVDILAEVRRIRGERLEHSDQLLPDVDPDDVPAWLAARRAGLRALADGTITAPPAAQGQIDMRVAAALPGVFQRPPRPLAITADGGDRPRKVAPPAPTVHEADAAAMEAERVRQLAALAQLAGPTGDDTVAGRSS